MRELKTLRAEVTGASFEAVPPGLRQLLDARYGAQGYEWDGITRTSVIHRVDGRAWQVEVRIWVPC